MALALTALVLGVLWRALMRGRAHLEPLDRQTRANAAVYREQWAELDRDHAAGRISEAEWVSARAELEARLLQDVEGQSPAATRPPESNWVRTTLTGLVLGVPLLSGGLYLALGQPAALDPRVRLAGLPQEEITPEKVERMGQELRARLEKNPDQADDWVMLARIERALERFEPAQQAMARALKLSDNPDWAIERAEMLASRNQGRFDGEPWQIILSVLKADPANLGALLLAGSASFAESRYPQALRYWEKASELVPASSPDRQPLDQALAQVRAQLGLPDPQARSIAATAIHGRVSLAGEAAKAVRPDDTVFIYATLPDARMPLAILRIRASELPYSYILDDRQAMNPQARLSMAERVVVRARVSRSGQAQAQADDWGAEQADVKPGTRGVNLVVQKPLQSLSRP